MIDKWGAITFLVMCTYLCNILFAYPASIYARYRSSVSLLFKQHSTHYPASTEATLFSSIQRLVIEESCPASTQPQIMSSIQFLVNRGFFHQSSFYLSDITIRGHPFMTSTKKSGF